MPTIVDPAGAMKLAAQWQRSGRMAEAAALYHQLLAKVPDMPGPLHNLGMIEFGRGNLAEALSLIERAVKAVPGKAEYHNALGTVLRELEKHAESAAAFKEAVKLKPDYAEATANLGAALGNARDFQQSIEYQLKALELNPNFAPAYNNLGVAYAKLRRNAESEEAYRKAIALDPHYGEAHFNYATILHEQGRYDEARTRLDESIRLRPTHPLAHMDLSMILIRNGDYVRGWKEYEWRKKWRTFLAREFQKPAWDGTPLPGQTILIYEEQGYGDTLQFVRYAPQIAAMGMTVIVEARKELHPLLATVPGVSKLVSRMDAVNFDVHQSLLSLPHVLGTTLETVPAATPYITPPEAEVARWRQALADLPTGRKVGLVWAGNAKHANNRNRSMKLEQFAPLAGVEDVTFISLQKGEEAGQIQSANGGLQVVELPGSLDTFESSAGLIANLDLVIAVDTAVAHLAGALARPVWTLLPYVPDFRWLRDREDSPWYPTMRLYRQRARGDWDEVLRRVRETLDGGSLS